MRRKTKNHKKPRRIPKSRFVRSKVKGTLPSVSELSLDSTNNTVINLTDRVLTPAQLYVLWLSHSFAPTPSLPSISQFEADLSKWVSKLRYRFYFSQKDNKTHTKSSEATLDLVRKFSKDKKTKPAAPSKCSALELFLDLVLKDARAFKSSCKYVCNLTICVRKREMHLRN